MSIRGIPSSILLCALALFPIHSAFAHGTGAIVLSTKLSYPGGTVTVRGTEFAKNSSVRLELRGVLANQVFGRVQTSAKGTFEQVVTVPAASKPGQYSIVAVAPDGDVVAQAILMLSEAPAAAGTQTGMPDMPGMPGMPGMPATGGAHATGEMMEVAIPTTASGWAVITAIIVLSAATGVWLLRSGRRTQTI